MLDGVSRLTDGVPIFQAIPAPTTDHLQTVLTRIITRLLKAFTRHGALMAEDTEIPCLTNPAADPALAPLQTAACTSRSALGPRAGQKVLTWKDPSLNPPAQRYRNQRVVSVPKGSVCMPTPGVGPISDSNSNACVATSPVRPSATHAYAACLCESRQTGTPAGEVVLQLKTPYRDGTTHLVMTPLEFLQRLAALVPRPRLHLIRFHGVLAPNAALRSQIVPGEADPAPTTANNGDGEAPEASNRTRLSWAQLLKRLFEIDITTCPHAARP